MEEFPKKEEFYKNWIQSMFGGKTEVHVPGVGYIDNITSSFILEVKHVDNFREAIGQVLHYWVVLKERGEALDREPAIFLFDHKGPIAPSFKEQIRRICSHARIRHVMFYPGVPKQTAKTPKPETFSVKKSESAPLEKLEENIYL